jgi:hypothetical protein
MCVRSLPLAKPFAALLIVIAALVVPGTALSHGVAHHEAHEHGIHYAVASGHEDVVVSVPNPDLAHQHPSVDQGRPIRGDIPLPAPAVAVELPVVVDTPAPVSVPEVREVRPRGDPAAGPPPSLRAPPTR